LFNLSVKTGVNRRGRKWRRENREKENLEFGMEKKEEKKAV